MNTQLIDQLYEVGVVKLGQFTLKSGAQSPIYIDIRQIISFPGVLGAVAAALSEQVSTLAPPLICGVPYTALPIATCISQQLNIPMLMRRKEAKNYGTKRMIEGVFEPGQNCVVIEDVLTTGGSVLETAELLREQGLQVKHVVAVLDREQGALDNLQAAGIMPHVLLRLSEVVKHLSTSPAVATEHQAALSELVAE